MIFDNVESIEDIHSKYVPTTSGAVIITSRRPDNALPKSSEISLKPSPFEAATKVRPDPMRYSSSQVLNDKDKDAIKALATNMDGHSIGLSVIADSHGRKNTTVSKSLKTYNNGACKLKKTTSRIIDYKGDSTHRVGSEQSLQSLFVTDAMDNDASPELLPICED